MPTAYIDRLDNLNLTERHGVIRSLTRKARVLFTNRDWPKDFSVLSAAMAIMPAPFTSPMDIAGNVINGYQALNLIERSPSLAENDPSVVDVVLKYEHILDGPNQRLIPAKNGLLFGKGRCSVTEKSTNFYYPYGDHTAPRTQILVAHTFTANEQGVVGQVLFDPNLPQTVFQGGEVTIPFPQENFSLAGVLSTPNPRTIARLFTSGVNQVEWLGSPPLTWLCSEVKWEVLDISSPIANYSYRFEFEFQYNSDTWYPTVVFNDQRTGRPPFNVRPATINDPTLEALNPDLHVLSYTPHPVNGLPQPAGYWNVPALRQVDFNRLFASFWEGFNIPLIQ